MWDDKFDSNTFKTSLSYLFWQFIHSTIQRNFENASFTGLGLGRNFKYEVIYKMSEPARGDPPVNC